MIKVIFEKSDYTIKLISIVYLGTNQQIFFVLTEQCRNEGTDFPCDQMNLGLMSFNTYTHCFIAAGSRRTGSSPGHWIAEDIEPQKFTLVDLERSAEARRVLQAHAIEQGGPVLLPEREFSVTLYIYCPPCACQVAAAFAIWQSAIKSRYLHVRIRVDYRQSTSCSMPSSRIAGVASLIDYIKSLEPKPDLSDDYIALLRAFDRQWLEQSYYHYKEEVHITTPSPTNRLLHVIRAHRNEPLTADIVILGEADYCISFMGAAPFPPLPRRSPRETELYKAIQHWTGPPSRQWVWQRHYMGTSSQKKTLKRKRPLHVTLGTEADGHKSEPRSKRSDTSNPGQVSSQN